MSHLFCMHKTSFQISISISDEALIEASLNGKCTDVPKVQNFDFRKYSIHDHVHLELDFLRAVEYVSTHPNANDEIMNLYDSSFAKNAVRYVYSIIRCVTTIIHRCLRYATI